MESKIEIGIGKYIVMSSFQGILSMHVRYYERDVKTGTPYPTKKGVRLGPSEFANLMQLAGELTNEIESKQRNKVEYHKHLGHGVYVTIKESGDYKKLDIRQYFKPEDAVQPLPTRKGITLSEKEWGALLDAEEDIRKGYSEFGNSMTTICIGLHASDEERDECNYCNPFPAADDHSEDCKKRAIV